MSPKNAAQKGFDKLTRKGNQCSTNSSGVRSPFSAYADACLWHFDFMKAIIQMHRSCLLKPIISHSLFGICDGTKATINPGKWTQTYAAGS